MHKVLHITNAVKKIPFEHDCRTVAHSPSFLSAQMERMVKMRTIKLKRNTSNRSS